MFCRAPLPLRHPDGEIFMPQPSPLFPTRGGEFMPQRWTTNEKPPRWAALCLYSVLIQTETDDVTV